MNYSKYFKDKIAFVTGGGEGLGRSLSLKLAEYNAIDFIEKGIAPETASQIILNGIIQNKKMIVFPTSFKIYYFLTKIFRFLERNMVLNMIRDFREKDRLE